jgi:parvulin-like peptidyl-prolyl isomerase
MAGKKGSKGGTLTVGRLELEKDEVIPVLSIGQLWVKVIRELVLDRAIAREKVTDEELASYYGKELAKEPGYFERMGRQLEAQGVPAERVRFFLARPLLVIRFKERVFAPHVSSLFLKQKQLKDSVVFSVIRHKERDVLEELLYRVEAGECSFAETAAKYSEGRESVTGGMIGPVAIGRLSPHLQKILSPMQEGELSGLFLVLDTWGLAQLHRKIHAELDEKMADELVESQFREWLDSETKKYIEGAGS